MDRIEIEVKLNRDRAWLLERLASMPDEERRAPRTHSEHDPDSTWSYADHFIHTTLIERQWNDMFRRHVAGDRGLEPRRRSDGSPQSMDEIMAGIHAWTEEWKAEHADTPFEELVRIGLATRSETLALLAALSDDELASTIPGAPWADGTVGGIMAANADHGRMHFAWAKADPVGAGSDAGAHES
ncbi:MAG: DinB family protein [Actinomycetota bacterium]